MSFMNRLLVLAAIVVSACAGAVVSQLVIPPAHAGVTQRWEYLCFNAGDHEDAANVKKLNEAGSAGWELTTTTFESRNGWSYDAVHCMKRPAP